jgi:hypothetical protein
MAVKDAVLTIRFVGPELKKHGMPIYELGTAFIAVQRIFHKAHLAQSEQLTKGKYPEKALRKSLALQIGAHERQSDFFGLIPILSDPSAVNAITAATKFVFAVVKAYAEKKVLDVLKGENNESRQIYIGSVQADVVNIVNRIDNIGGCESIEIGAPRYAPQQVLEFDAGTRDYVRQLGYEYFLGKSQELVGDVFKLYPYIGMVEVRRPGRKKCKVFLSEPDFERVRLSKNPSPRINVYGRPRYHLRAEGRAFNEFEGQALREVDDEG